MKRYFNNRLEAINWIADFAKDEGQFEVLREQMNFNQIYSGRIFVDTKEAGCEVVMMKENK